MPYFAVDDQITFHPKAVAAGNAAMGAWTRAGAWAKNHATGGFVALEVAHAIGAKESKRLVAVGLWDAGDHPEYGAGYWFHDWEHVAGNFDGETEKARREAKRQADRDRQRQKRDRDRESSASHAVTPTRISAPSVPSPSPLTDVTNSPASTHEIPARAIGISRELVSILDERAIAQAAEVGITKLSETRQVLEHTVAAEMSLSRALEVCVALMSKSTERVGNPAAYVATICRETPATVFDVVQMLDNEGAVA